MCPSRTSTTRQSVKVVCEVCLRDDPHRPTLPPVQTTTAAACAPLRNGVLGGRCQRGRFVRWVRGPGGLPVARSGGLVRRGARPVAGEPRHVGACSDAWPTGHTTEGRTSPSVGRPEPWVTREHPSPLTPLTQDPKFRTQHPEPHPTRPNTRRLGARPHLHDDGHPGVVAVRSRRGLQGRLHAVPAALLRGAITRLRPTPTPTPMPSPSPARPIRIQPARCQARPPSSQLRCPRQLL